MVRGQFKSRTFRRIKVKTPGGKVTIHYRKRKPSAAQCADCGVNLKGVPRERPVVMRTMAKTKKRPERPFGGKLCSACTRKIMVSKAREV